MCTDTTDENIAHEEEITIFSQLPIKTSLRYVKELVAKTPRFEDVFEHYDLNNTCTKGVDILIHQGMRE